MTALGAVLSAFFGVRKSKRSLAEHGVKPIHLVLAALLCVLTLVVTLIGIVRFVLR